MPVYAVEVRFVEDTDLIDQTRPEHRRFIDDLAAEETVWLAGPWEDGTGGLIVYNVPDEVTLERLIAEDPYTLKGVVAERRINLWKAVLGSKA